MRLRSAADSQREFLVLRSPRCSSSGLGRANHAVIESVQMQKVRGHICVWEADTDHIKCIKKKFKQLTKAELVKAPGQQFKTAMFTLEKQTESVLVC